MLIVVGRGATWHSGPVAALIKLTTALVIPLDLLAISASASATATVVLSTSVLLLALLLVSKVTSALISESRLLRAMTELMIIALADTASRLLILRLAGRLIISSHLLSVIARWCILELLLLVSFCVVSTHHAWEWV